MTAYEIELLVLLFKYKKAHDRSNPDVGMGPTDEMLMDELQKELTFPILASTRERVISKANE